jgi:hypothetical protein
MEGRRGGLWSVRPLNDHPISARCMPSPFRHFGSYGPITFDIALATGNIKFPLQYRFGVFLSFSRVAHVIHTG